MQNITPEPTDPNISNDLLKPEIFKPDKNSGTFNAGMNYSRALKELESGNALTVRGSYATAISFYSWLKKKISSKYPVHDHISSRKTRRVLNETASKILAGIKGHRIDLSGAPEIPWLKAFYADNHDFLIPLTDLLGMNGAWQWYKNGVTYPIPEQKLHPFYGVYFPSRTGHLVMFDNWLSYNIKKFRYALDIGTGCGILSLIMAKHGIEKIHATDINPNAVYSASLEFARIKMAERISVEKTSLFGSAREVSGLVVFNPPWIPGKCMNMMDRGIYYEKGFFENFFREADKRMAPGSTMAIIFSSFAIEAGIAEFNPVEKFTGLNNCFILKEKITGKVTERTGKLSRSWVNSIREKEETELWILQKPDSL